MDLLSLWGRLRGREMTLSGRSDIRAWTTYPIPLQESGVPVLANLRVPTDLTRAEAARITEMIEALVVTVEQEGA